MDSAQSILEVLNDRCEHWDGLSATMAPDGRPALARSDTLAIRFSDDFNLAIDFDNIFYRVDQGERFSDIIELTRNTRGRDINAEIAAEEARIKKKQERYEDDVRHDAYDFGKHLMNVTVQVPK